MLSPVRLGLGTRLVGGVMDDVTVMKDGVMRLRDRLMMTYHTHFAVRNSHSLTQQTQRTSLTPPSFLPPSLPPPTFPNRF